MTTRPYTVCVYSSRGEPVSDPVTVHARSPADALVGFLPPTHTIPDGWTIQARKPTPDHVRYRYHLWTPAPELVAKFTTLPAATFAARELLRGQSDLASCRVVHAMAKPGCPRRWIVTLDAVTEDIAARSEPCPPRKVPPRKTSPHPHGETTRGTPLELLQVHIGLLRVTIDVVDARASAQRQNRSEFLRRLIENVMHRSTKGTKS